MHLSPINLTCADSGYANPIVRQVADYGRSFCVVFNRKGEGRRTGWGAPLIAPLDRGRNVKGPPVSSPSPLTIETRSFVIAKLRNPKNVTVRFWVFLFRILIFFYIYYPLFANIKGMATKIRLPHSARMQM